MGQGAQRWRRLGPLAGFVLAAHAAVLSLPVRPAAGSPVMSTAPVIQTRTLSTASPAPVPDRPTPEPVAAPPTPVAQAARRLAEPAPTPAPLAAPEQVQAVVPPASLHDEVPTAVGGLSLPGIADDDDLFVARSLLSVPPVATAPVLIDFPAFAGQAERYRGELTLFIDEQGVVVRVRAEGDALPAPLEEAARRAFMAVRFSPGELGVQGAVKSRIRVEVVFEGPAPPLLS